MPGNYVIPEFYAQHPRTWRILRNATVEYKDFTREEDLELEIYNHAEILEAKLLPFITEKKVDLICPNNLCSGGYQPAAAIAFHRVIRRTGIPAIIHSHDFYFEDSGEVKATCHVTASIYERSFPPKLPSIQHVVINRLSQAQIKQRKNIDAMVVPNVFDLDQPLWQQDAFNADFRAAIGLGKDDLVFLQATRILDRKGIEMAIDTVAALGTAARRKALTGVVTADGGRFAAKNRIVLLCAGIVETIGIPGDYWGALQRRAKALGVDLVHVGERVKHSRDEQAPQKVYSLWDSYVHADFVTYPSTWEGWGNQFIEAVFAKLPILIYEYPVWTSDLAEAGFDMVSLGDTLSGKHPDGLVYVDQKIVEKAADQIVAILQSAKRRQEIGDQNFAIARERYSLHALQKIISNLVAKSGVR